MPCAPSGPARARLAVRAAVLLAVCLPVAGQAPPADRGPEAPQPQWIWAPGEPAPEACRLRVVFEVAAPVRRARLRMTCDNAFTAWLGGERVLAGDEWQRAYRADVGARLAPGTVVLAVEARNAGGPCGLIGRLDVEYESGARATICTDAAWQACVDPSDGDARWRDDRSVPAVPVRVVAPLGAPPWGDPFAPRTATPADSLRVRAGYRATLVRSAAEHEGSWIAMAFDESGRLWLSVERGGLLLLRDPAGEAEPEPVALPEDVCNVHGLAFAAGALWLNVNRNDAKGGLYRARDLDGDGAFEDVQRVFAWAGDGEHGAHAVVPGPDGWLWVVNGNMTALPEGLSPASPHRLFAEDVLLPPIEDPNGHAVGVKAPGCHVLRIAPDGSAVELFGAGLRNAYDLAFDAHGELYTFDSDMEWDLGLPWYRPVRFCRVVSGAEFGWRSGTGCWPVHWFDSLPAVLDVGRGSPTGLAFWYGTRVAPADHGALVAADWALGRILLVRVDRAPATAELLVSGRPLNVTDVAIGPDGALWFVTGGRRTQSGLYRIAAVEPAPAAPEIPPLPPQRLARRALEAFHRAPDPAALDAAWPALGARDPELRHAARVAVERQPVDVWRARALAEREPAAACAALLALARAGDARDLADLAARWLALAPESLPLERRSEALRVLWVALSRHGTPDPDLRAALAGALRALPSGGDVRIERERGALLIALGADGLVTPLLDALHAQTSQSDQIAFAFLLSHVGDGWRGADLERFGAWLRGARARLGGGDSFTGYLDAIASRLAQRLADPGLRAAAGAWKDRPRPAADRLEPGPFVRAWTMADLEPHLDAVGVGRSFAAGERAARTAQCFACHRFASRGGSIGPDLTSIGSRMSRRDLLQAILAPSEVVSDQYRTVVLTMRDGRTHAGRIVRDADGSIELLTDPVAGTSITLPAAEVAARTISPVSLMPPGLLNTLTLEQVLDLLAYFECDADPRADAFR